MRAVSHPMVVVIGAALLGTLCGTGSAAAKTRLMVFAGAASKPPAQEAKKVYEKAHPDVQIDITFGGSGTILQQMMLEQIGDIYMPGSDDFMDKAEAKKAVIPETRKIVAYLIENPRPNGYGELLIDDQAFGPSIEPIQGIESEAGQLLAGKFNLVHTYYKAHTQTLT